MVASTKGPDHLQQERKGSADAPMDVEVTADGLRLQGIKDSGPVALLSFYEQQNFVDDLGRPLYLEAVTATSLQYVRDAGGVRYYGGSFDANAAAGEDIVLDELPSKDAAFQVVRKLEALVGTGVIAKLSVLAMTPVRLPLGITLHRGLGPLSSVLNTVVPLTDPKVSQSSLANELGKLHDPVKDDVTAIYSEDLGHKKMFMLNLNKFRKIALYGSESEEAAKGEMVSGVDAYRRYAAPLSLLRRGAFPYYMGTNVKTVLRTENGTLEDASWDQCILVHYPYRNRVVEMIMSPSYGSRLHHRTAALEQALVQPTSPWLHLLSDSTKIESKL